MPIGVLLVDDNPAHLELLTILLELEDDFRLLAAAPDGEEGVARAAEFQPDLIVSDIEMPRLNGLAATPLFREVAPSAVVVLMSNMEPIEAENLARAAGADLFIDKGTGVDTMMRMLKAAVREQPEAPAVIDLRDETTDQSPVTAGPGATPNHGK